MDLRIPHLASRISIMALLCVSCATLGRLAFTEPDVKLQEIAVTGIGLTGGTFELAFDVYNPNDYRIRSTRLEVGIDLEGTHFGDALLDRPLDLSPTNHSRIVVPVRFEWAGLGARSEEHTSELQSRLHLVCRLLLEKKKKKLCLSTRM